jgi:hypothetical protein
MIFILLIPLNNSRRRGRGRTPDTWGDDRGKEGRAAGEVRYENMTTEHSFFRQERQPYR